MREIGGYFGLELPRANSTFLHSEGCLVNSGRHALEYILRSLGTKIRKLWLPHYTCEVVLQPIERFGIEHESYHTDFNFEIVDLPDLQPGEYIIANNYFGIKDAYVSTLARHYGERLIVDNAQAWYAPVLPGIKCFYSPRKFFGLPDGGVAFTHETPLPGLERDCSASRCAHLLKRIDENAEAGYADFRSNSSLLSATSLKKMSRLTQSIIETIDMDIARNIRRSNYAMLDEALGGNNQLQLPDMESFNCPMVYPFMSTEDSLRKRLIENKVFVATYWPNVLSSCSYNSSYIQLVKYILPLPIDQRYGKEEMQSIINIIL